MANTPQLSPLQNQRLRQAMHVWLQRPKMAVLPGEKPVLHNHSDLARALGLRQPTISDFIQAKNGASYDTARRFATLLETTVDALIGPDERGSKELLVERANARLQEWRELPGYMDALRSAIAERPDWSPLVWEGIAREKAVAGRTQVLAADLIEVGDRLQRAEQALQRKGLVHPRSAAEPKTPYRRYMSDVRKLAGIVTSPRNPTSGGMKTSR